MHKDVETDTHTQTGDN